MHPPSPCGGFADSSTDLCALGVCICGMISLTKASNNHHGSFPVVLSFSSFCALHRLRRARGGGGVTKYPAQQETATHSPGDRQPHRRQGAHGHWTYLVFAHVHPNQRLGPQLTVVIDDGLRCGGQTHGGGGGTPHAPPAPSARPNPCAGRGCV